MGSLEEFAETLSGFRQVTFDTNTCIYYFQPESQRSPLAAEAIRRALTGELTIELPGVVQLELLIRPFRSGIAEEMRAVRSFMDRMRGITSTAISRDVIFASAAIRAVTGMKTPDSLVAGSAAVHGSDAIIGNDGMFSKLNAAGSVTVVAGRKVRLPRYIHLDDYVGTAKAARGRDG